MSEDLKQQRGPCFWKFNSSLLKDKQYISNLHKNLTHFVEKYHDIEDLGLKWDLIRGFTVKFSKAKARGPIQPSSVLTNQFDILEGQSKFYQSLYNLQKSDSSDKPDDDVFFTPNNISTLPDNEQALCEGLITEIEAFKALKEFAVAKSPGTDGLTTEFLKFFWPELKLLIVE